MIREASLTNPYTQLDILSLPPVAPIFPLQILKLSWQTASRPLESLCWDIINSQKLYNWGYKPSERSDSASISLNLHLWIHDYFTFKYILLYSNYYCNLNSFKRMIRVTSLTILYRWHSTGILSAHWCYTAKTINHTKISDFASIYLNLHHWVHDYFTSK